MLAIALCAGPAAAEEAALPVLHPELVRTYYDFAVAEYCRLVDASVYSGALLLHQDQLARGKISRAADRRAWIDATVAADLEYQNRGLGGQRNWCRNEGADAARRFTTYFRNRSLP